MMLQKSFKMGICTINLRIQKRHKKEIKQWRTIVNPKEEKVAIPLDITYKLARIKNDKIHV